MPRNSALSALAIALALILSITSVTPGMAQELEPALTTPECDVEPLTDEEVATLTQAAATPVAATPAPVSPATFPEGDPVDPVILDLLVRTLREVDACAAAGDLPRLLALYTEAAIEQLVLAPEPVPIVPGQPPADFSVPLPDQPQDLTPALTAAVLLEDGRIAAQVTTVEPGNPTDIVWFVEVDGRWLIDDIQPTTLPTPAGVVPPEAQEITELVLEDAANQLAVPVEEMLIINFDAVEWPNAALGCPEEGEVAAEVVTPGYRIIVTDGVTALQYHTDLEGNYRQCGVE
jgi:hypothetical protein